MTRPNADATPSEPWYATPADEIFSALATDEEGLSSDGFRERVPSRRRNVDRLGPLQLDSFATCIRKLLIEGDPREDFEQVLSRVGPTRFDAEVQRRIDYA